MDPNNPVNSPLKPNTPVAPPVQTIVSPPVVPVPNVQPTAPVPATIPTPPPPSTTVVYADFGTRLAAALIDGIIIIGINFVVSFFIGFVIGFVDGMNHVPFVMTTSLKQLVNTVSYAVGIFYYVYFIGSRGQTFGKQITKIKVVKIGTNNPPGYFSAFLREIVGKFISFIVILLGFFWMLWDPQKQTWHDKIAGTVVIKT